LPVPTTEFDAVADYLRSCKETILKAWRASVSALSLCVGASLSEVEFFDHVPALLDTFENQLRQSDPCAKSVAMREFPRTAATHGLKRWQQGYDLTELVRELGQLNECVVDVIDHYTDRDPTISHESIATVRRVWAHFTTVGIEESVGKYAFLQREEARGQVQDLEEALAELRSLEAQRGDLWQQAAHDLRGNLGVVANASVGLTHSTLAQPARDGFVRILIRNVSSLHQLLDDVTELARLQAGRESRRVQSIDVTPLLHELCEGIRPVALGKKLFLQCAGPAGLGAQSDPVKLRRIAQNLILNAVKFTQTGGITVKWGESDPEDPGHWVLTIADTGPGFPSKSGLPIANAMESVPPLTAGSTSTGDQQGAEAAAPATVQPKIIDSGAGEGLGLSIVKRLCEILDATIERHSLPNEGTTFRLRFPKTYAGA
jgi:signal transduction histidine kinase